MNHLTESRPAAWHLAQARQCRARLDEAFRRGAPAFYLNELRERWRRHRVLAAAAACPPAA